MGPALRHGLHWLAALIGLPVVLVAGMPFYRSAWAAIRAGRPSMDLAVSLGVLATAAMSLSETLRNGPYTWFDGATMLLALLLAGPRVRPRGAAAGAAIGGGIAGAAGRHGHAACWPMAHMEAVPTEAVVAGDRVLVVGRRTAAARWRRGGRGAARCRGDHRGERAAPLRRRRRVAGRRGEHGRGLHHDGQRGGEGWLARRHGAAAGTRGTGQGPLRRHRRPRLAVLCAGGACSSAAATFLGWWGVLDAPWQVALVNAVCVLLITCPCALALAVPAVQVVAVGALFRRGVLVTSATALERLATRRPCRCSTRPAR